MNPDWQNSLASNGLLSSMIKVTLPCAALERLAWTTPDTQLWLHQESGGGLDITNKEGMKEAEICAIRQQISTFLLTRSAGRGQWVRVQWESQRRDSELETK